MFKPVAVTTTMVVVRRSPEHDRGVIQVEHFEPGGLDRTMGLVRHALRPGRSLRFHRNRAAPDIAAMERIENPSRA